MNTKHWAVLGLATLALGACGSDAQDPPDSPAGSQSDAMPATGPPVVVPAAVEPKTMSTNGHMEPLNTNGQGVADLAIRALADELDIPITEIEVDTVRAIDWPDTSVGCPQPGMSYGQVITPGHKITLRVDGAIHVVHEANGRAFVCKIRKDPNRTTGQIDLVWGQQAVVARRDLASRLGVEERNIMISGASQTTFTDTSLGCPEPGVEYTREDRPGFVLKLRTGNRDFTYHTDLERTIPCPAIAED